MRPKSLNASLKKVGVMKKSLRLLGISSFILFLLVSPAAAEITQGHLDFNTMVYTDDSGFVFDPSGYMRLKFGDGFLELWVFQGFGWWVSDGVLFVDGYIPGL
jgi:hypothetical protein